MDEQPSARDAKFARAFDQHMRSLAGDQALLERALGLLHRFATENTGWKAWFVRWYYSDEPLRNDAANLVRLARFGMPMPIGTRLVGDDE